MSVFNTGYHYVRWCQLATILCFLPYAAAHALTPMNEQEMSVADGGTALTTQQTAGANSLDFFKLGINANVQLNVNIAKVALGCGGANNAIAAGCDIDLDNVSLSGSATTSNGRAQSDAEFKNPYIEFAIKNAKTQATREVVGIRLGSELAKGLLTIGKDNGSTPNGINQLSGSMNIQSYAGSNTIEGSAHSNPEYVDFSKYPVSGRLTALGVAVASYHSISGGLQLPGMLDIPFSIPAVSLNSSRVQSLDLNIPIVIPKIILGVNQDDYTCGLIANSACNTYGTPAAGFPATGSQSLNAGAIGTQGGPAMVVVDSCSALGFIPCWLLGVINGQTQLNTNFYGVVENLKINVPLKQPLGFVHRLEINNPLSLSLQNQSILWPNAETPAQKGWWLAANNPVYLGAMTMPDPISFCTNPNDAKYCLFPQIAEKFSKRGGSDNLNKPLSGNRPQNRPILGSLWSNSNDETY